MGVCLQIGNKQNNLIYFNSQYLVHFFNKYFYIRILFKGPTSKKKNLMHFSKESTLKYHPIFFGKCQRDLRYFCAACLKQFYYDSSLINTPCDIAVISKIFRPMVSNFFFCYLICQKHPNFLFSFV